jgi:flagellar hook-associated protein 1 FlgK
MNTRLNSTSVTGQAQRVPPSTTQPTLQAILVDADGNELPKQNGKYLNNDGYLKIIASQSGTGVSIDSLDSAQRGNNNIAPPVAASNLGFSSYFSLNNFFTSNAITETGDTIKGSALNFKVEQRILDNPSLVSTGKLVRQQQPSDPAQAPQYTYVQYSGDNTIAQKLAGLNSAVISFDSAGGLPASQTTLQTYVGNLLADLASKSSAATDTNTNAQSLLSGFESRASSVSGVNLDDELANTVIYQNAYEATARVISVVNKMYDALLNIL